MGQMLGLAARIEKRRLKKESPIFGSPLTVGHCCFRKFIMRNLFLKLASIPALVLAGVSAAHAQAAPAFTSAITAVTSDIAIYGAALVGVAAVGVTFMIAMKYVKKIPKAG